MSFGLWCNFGNAAAPTQDNKGRLWPQSALIVSNNIDDVQINLVPVTYQTYTGQALPLIDNLTVTTRGTSGYELYLRAVPKGEDNGPYIWTKVINLEESMGKNSVNISRNTANSALASITGVNPGYYDIYLWLDGKDIYTDNNYTEVVSQ